MYLCYTATQPSREITDPKAMRALAHPVRLAILDAMRNEGELTATRAADLLNQSPGNMSWHLQTLAKYGFIVEAEGVILCFVIFLIPGLPKDMTCYLFGLSPMPFWVFAVVSTLGRIPGTWVLSAQGAHTASGDYVEVILLTALAVALALPLYYYRNRLVEWFRGKQLDSARMGRK